MLSPEVEFEEKANNSKLVTVSAELFDPSDSSMVEKYTSEERTELTVDDVRQLRKNIMNQQAEKQLFSYKSQLGQMDVFDEDDDL